MSRPIVKMTTNTSWSIGYLKKIMEFLPDDTEVTTFGFIKRGLCFELPEGFGVETTVKQPGASPKEGGYHDR